MLRQFLTEQAQAYTALGAPRGMAQFILAVADLETSNVRHAETMGEQKECFFNSGKFICTDPERYDYVEGYVITENLPVAIHHGWVWDKVDEIVIEPTIRDLTEETHYLGKRFDLNAQHAASVNWGYWCLFDSPSGPNIQLMNELVPGFFDVAA